MGRMEHVVCFDSPTGLTTQQGHIFRSKFSHVPICSRVQQYLAAGVQRRPRMSICRSFESIVGYGRRMNTNVDFTRAMHILNRFYQS